MQELDRIFIATNVSKVQLERNNARMITRFEFLEAIVRVALAKYFNPRIAPSQSAAVALLIDKHLLPFAERLDGMECVL